MSDDVGLISTNLVFAQNLHYWIENLMFDAELWYVSKPMIFDCQLSNFSWNQFSDFCPNLYPPFSKKGAQKL